MALQKQSPGGSWLMAEDLLERGDPAFVDELRRISDAERLGTFAAKWIADQRPASRVLLLEYLNRPFNAFRHEALLKRLFKLAEKQNDDVLMARFLVGTDRLIRRVRRKRSRYDTKLNEYWTTERLAIPYGSTIPKDPRRRRYRNPSTGEFLFASTQEKHDKLRLFSPHTRHYLRRRTWRYFRNIGKADPQRYIAGITEALQQYTDNDVIDGIALLDNWGLVHALFHHSPALVAKSNGWILAEGRSLADLAPAPAFESHWQISATPLLGLIREARCRPVRQWAVQVLRTHFPNALNTLPLSELLALIVHDDPGISQLAVEALRQSPVIANLRVDAWLKLLDTANPQTLSVLSELMEQHLTPGSISLPQLVKLTCSRPIPIARLGLNWLKSRNIESASEQQSLLELFDAECLPVRPDLITWTRSVLCRSPHFAAAWVLEMLDSSYEDVRKEGWSWFIEEPRACHDVILWQRLLESPYDDIKLQLILLLEGQIKIEDSATIVRSRLAPELVRFLWASVLLNIHRGSRVKPRVVGQIIERLKRRPQEARELLPLLAVSLRSVRGTEWRAGLAGLVQLLENQPELESVVAQMFPELKLTVL
jgi:hypothetical protein